MGAGGRSAESLRRYCGYVVGAELRRWVQQGRPKLPPVLGLGLARNGRGRYYRGPPSTTAWGLIERGYFHAVHTNSIKNVHICDHLLKNWVTTRLTSRQNICASPSGQIAPKIFSTSISAYAGLQFQRTSKRRQDERPIRNELRNSPNGPLLQTRPNATSKAALATSCTRMMTVLGEFS